MIIMNISGPQILVVNGFTLAVTGLGDQQTHADFTVTCFTLANDWHALLCTVKVKIIPITHIKS